MSDYIKDNKDGCPEFEHEQHLCHLLYAGFHKSNKEEFKKMVQDARFRCDFCGRTAKNANNLCKPVEL
jgi:hypothetical protein